MSLSQNHDKPMTLELFYSRWIGVDTSNLRVTFMGDLEAMKEHYISEGYDLGLKARSKEIK